MRDHGKGVLIVRATQERVTARATLSNEGTKPLGPEQMRIDVDLNALMFDDDSLTLTWSGTPAQPGELEFGRFRYAVRLSRDGTEAALVGSGSVARPGAYLEPLHLQSRSWYVGGEILHPLLRRRNASLWIQSEFGVRDLLQRRDGVRQREERTAVSRLTLYGYGDVAGGRLRVSTSLSQGLGIFGATRAGDPEATRADADATFTTLSAWADWTTDLGGDLSLRLAMQSQLSSQPLLISEEIGLGGTGFLRGYGWSERTGDEGVMGLLELRYLLSNPFGLARRAQLYAFADGGRVTNLDNGFGGGTLASAGMGVRADLTGTFGANVELAFPLSGYRYDTGDETPKLNLSLQKSF
jgi:hemolysin activation/secretion protein